jgi:hypothetical protein
MRAGRSAAGADKRWSDGRRKRRSEKFQPIQAFEFRQRCCSDDGSQIVRAAVRNRSTIRGRVGDTTLAEREFFHLRAHGVQIVRGGNNREQQKYRAGKRAQEDKRRHCRAPGNPSCGTAGNVRGTTLAPEQISGQQQRKPTKVKKKLHTKRLMPCQDASQTQSRAIFKCSQDSTTTASDLRTHRFKPRTICPGSRSVESEASWDRSRKRLPRLILRRPQRKRTAICFFA